MNQDEIVRRIKALLLLDPAKRPISVDKLEELSGIADNGVYDIARQGRMQDRTREKLARVFTLLENDQISVQHRHGGRGGSKPAIVSINPVPKPPVAYVRCIKFTEHGPRVVNKAINPLTFPPYSEAKMKKVKSA